MNCGTAHEWMQRELDGELGSLQIQELRRHCEVCDSCRQRQRQLTAIRAATTGLAAITAPAERVPLVFTTRARSRRWWPVPVAAAAAIALLVGGYLALTASRPREMVAPIALVPNPAGVPESRPSLALAPSQSSPESGAVQVKVDIKNTNLIAVPMETTNPKVTIVWTYPRVELAASAKSSELSRQPS